MMPPAGVKVIVAPERERAWDEYHRWGRAMFAPPPSYPIVVTDVSSVRRLIGMVLDMDEIIFLDTPRLSNENYMAIMRTIKGCIGDGPMAASDRLSLETEAVRLYREVTA